MRQCAEDVFEARSRDGLTHPFVCVLARTWPVGVELSNPFPLPAVICDSGMRVTAPGLGTGEASPSRVGTRKEQ